MKRRISPSAPVLAQPMSWIIAIFCLFASLAATANAQTPGVTSLKSSYKVGENISITFINAPGNAKDWIGIYPEGVVPGTVGSTLWFYLDGTKTGNTGTTSGTMIFTNGLTATGKWVAYLLENDGYTKLANAAFSVVLAPVVTADKPSYSTNETISVAFAGGPGNAKDWIGIYPEGVVPGTVGSTLWFYGDGTKTGSAGKTSGTIVFTNGLATTGKWVAYLLENDGYTQLASASFAVGQPVLPPTVATQHSTYLVGTDVVVAFTNGPANPKDWIGIYQEAAKPGGPAATVWQYTDGSGGKAGVKQGIVTLKPGLPTAGKYVVYFLENDGYKILASNRLDVVQTDAPLLHLDRRLYQTKEPFSATFTNAPGNPKDWVGIYPEGVTPGSVGSTLWYYLDGTKTGNDVVLAGTVAFPTGLNAPGNWVAYLLENDAYNILARETFTVVQAAAVPTNNIVLPTPLHFENFDSTPEGKLPAGWIVQNHTEVQNDALDFGDLNSKTYADWVVVSASRFTNTFVTYSNPATPSDDYKRVLRVNPDNFVNGKEVTNLATGNFLFATSGYRNGRSQVLYAFTPDFNLSGKSNVFLSYHSLYEQNQDSIGAVEYSINGGANWLPIVYMIDGVDIMKDASGQVDAVATLTTEAADIAYYDDPVTGETKGGTYGAFIGAPIAAGLAKYISARVNDDAVESKRVELFRLTAADNQPKVRFRFAYAGTDSWYFGIDDFGIYSISSGTIVPLKLTGSAIQGGKIVLNWMGGTGSVQVQKKTSLTDASWQNVGSQVTGNSFTETISGSAAFYRLTTP